MTARTIRLVGLALSLVVIGGCSSAAAASTDAGRRMGASPEPVVTAVAPAVAAADRRLFVEGDSLTMGIEPYLPALVAAAGWSVTMDDQVGRTTATGAAILAARSYELGGTLVVALGTNDLPDPLVFSASVDQVMNIASGRRVIWLTVARSGWDGLDDALMAARTRWANLQVIDWRPVISAHPDMQASDGIHLTPGGYQLRAQFVAAAVGNAT